MKLSKKKLREILKNKAEDHSEELLDKYKLTQNYKTGSTKKYAYVDVIDSCKVDGEEVLRLTSYYDEIPLKKGANLFFHFKRIFTKFIFQDGREEVYSRKTSNIWYNWRWRLDLEVFNFVDNKSYAYRDKYLGVCENTEFIRVPSWCKGGMRLNKTNYMKARLDLHEFVNAYSKNPTLFETLIELKEYKAVYHIEDRKIDKKFNKAIIKAVRNRMFDRFNIYTNDARNYLDYLSLLDMFGYQYNQENWCCNPEWEKMHDRLSRKKSNESLKKEVTEYEPIYQERVKSLVDKEFGNEKYKVNILRTVKEFEEEAEDMGHCVFRNKYWKEENSLIFSIKNKETNERLETCEIDSTGWKIAQCHGHKNNNSEFHQEIVSLMKRKIGAIARAYLGA